MSTDSPRSGFDVQESGPAAVTSKIEGAAPRQAFLVLLSERFGDRVFPLASAGPTTIGRAPDRQIQIPDPQVSGLHAEVFARDGGWVLRDPGSKNGTRVNGVVVRGEVGLEPNARVELGGAATLFFTDKQFKADTGRAKRAVTTSPEHELNAGGNGNGNGNGARPYPGAPAGAAGPLNAAATSMIRSFATPSPDAGPAAGGSSPPAVRQSRSTITVPQAEVVEALRIPRPARVEGGLEERSIALLYQLAEGLGTSRTERDLLERALDLTLALIPADRGYVFLVDPRRPDALPEPAAMRRRQGFSGGAGDGITASTTILEEVIRDRAAVATSDAEQDERFSEADSVLRHRIHGVMAAPILHQERLLGIVYLEATAPGYMFHRSELMLLSAIAFQAALALENVRSVQALEARVAERAGEIERLSAERAQLLSIAAHDIKTPLAGMLGYLECVLPRAQEDPAARWIAGELSVVVDAARGIMDLLSDLLDRQRAEAGKIDLAPEPTDLGEFLRAATAIYERWAEGVGRGVELAIAAPLPPVAIDRRRVTQILNNLVHNALKYTPRGTAVRIEARAQSAPDLVEISVTDRGKGFDGGDTDRILASFVRGTSGEGAPASEGHGLGLHIVKKLVELHGGVLEIEGRPGKGARFAVRLPVGGSVRRR